LTPPDPQLKGAWYPRWFQRLHQSSKNPVSKFAFIWVNLCRYNKDSRKELVEQFDALKNKVSGEF
jgi:hypothetical protein